MEAICGYPVGLGAQGVWIEVVFWEGKWSEFIKKSGFCPRDLGHC